MEKDWRAGIEPLVEDIVQKNGNGLPDLRSFHIARNFQRRCDLPGHLHGFSAVFGGEIGCQEAKVSGAHPQMKSHYGDNCVNPWIGRLRPNGRSPTPAAFPPLY